MSRFLWMSYHNLDLAYTKAVIGNWMFVTKLKALKADIVVYGKLIVV